MKINPPIEALGGGIAAGTAEAGRLSFGVDPSGYADAALFREALGRYLQARPGDAGGPGSGKPSLGEKLVGRVSGLAGEIKKDQLYVSRMLEQASRTGDSMQLMRAMMALNDYQIRVQTISKTVAKSTQSFEQLTKLQ